MAIKRTNRSDIRRQFDNYHIQYRNILNKSKISYQLWNDECEEFERNNQYDYQAYGKALKK